MAPDNLTRCYSGIQRIYRNAVLGHFREILRKKHGESYESAIVQMLAKEWQQIESAANACRERGGLGSPLRDKLDVLGVNHFFNIFDSYFADLFPHLSSLAKNDMLAAKKTILDDAKTVKDLRDPLSHPGEADFTTADAHRVLGAAKRVLDSLHLSDASAKLLELQRNIDQRDYAPVGLSSLPPVDEVVVNFVGRQRELESLRSWMKTDNARRWALAGDGGKGKSAIAYHFATEQMCHPDGVDVVLWLSAKRRRFIYGQTALVDRPDFVDAASAARWICNEFGYADSSDCRKKAIELLDAFPALIVADDIDTLEGSGKDAIQFLLMDIPAQTRTKVLATSRLVVFGLENCTTTVSGLDEMDARDFIVTRCALMNLDPKTILQHLAKIRSVTDSSPLFIEDLLRLCLTGMSISKAVGIWDERRGQAAREYAIKKEFEQLTDDGQDALLAISLFGGPCTFEQIRSALNWPDDRLVNAVQSIQKLYLAASEITKTGVSNLVIGSNTRALIFSVFGSTQKLARMRQVVDAVQGKFESTKSQDAMLRGRLWTLQQRITADKSTTAMVEIEKEFKALESVVPGHWRLWSIWGWAYKVSDQLTDAREKLRRAIDLNARESDPFFHLIEIYIDDQEWDSAIEVCEKGVRAFPSDLGIKQQFGYALSRKAREIADSDSKGALTCSKKAENFLRQVIESQEQGYKVIRVKTRAYRGLVLVAEASGDSEAVKRNLSAWQKSGLLGDDFYTEYSRLSAKFPGIIAPIYDPE